MRNFSRFFISAIFFFAVASCEKDVQKEDSTENDQLKTTETGICTDETAWAEGARYLTKGNWATFIQTPAVLGVTGDDIVPRFHFYAGQKIEAGWVWFYSNPDGSVKIKIVLEPCFSFQDIKEPVKVQGYALPPFGVKPAPGKFTTFKGIPEWNEQWKYFYINVEKFPYYAIHLDLQNCCN